MSFSIGVGLGLGMTATGRPARRPVTVNMVGLTSGVACPGTSLSALMSDGSIILSHAWGSSKDANDYGVGEAPSDFSSGDGGELHLTVTTEAGNFRTSAPIRYPPPRFVVQPSLSPSAASVGDILTLDAGETTHPTEKTVERFTLDGVDISDAIVDGAWDSAGAAPGEIVYQVRATNSGGSVLSDLVVVRLSAGAGAISALELPTIQPVEHGQTLADTLLPSAIDTQNYSSTEGDGTVATVTAEWRVDNGPWLTLGATAVEFNETVEARVIVEDAQSNTRIFNAGSTVVAGIAPSLMVSHSLSSRTWTISVDSLTGTPAPTTALVALTLDGVDVRSEAAGDGPWVYEAPESYGDQMVAWTVAASNAVATVMASGSGTIPASLGYVAPDILAAPLGAVTDGQTIADIDYTITQRPSPDDAAYTEGVTVGGVFTPLPHAASAGEVIDAAVLVQHVTGDFVFTSGSPVTVASPDVPVSGILPVAAVTASLDGRVLTISDNGSTGVPVPILTLTALALNGTNVLGDAAGTGPWVYEVPSSTADQTVAYTVVASNIEGSDTASGSVEVLADLADGIVISTDEYDNGSELWIVLTTAPGAGNWHWCRQDPVEAAAVPDGSGGWTGTILESGTLAVGVSGEALSIPEHGITGTQYRLCLYQRVSNDDSNVLTQTYTANNLIVERTPTGFAVTSARSRPALNYAAVTYGFTASEAA